LLSSVAVEREIPDRKILFFEMSVEINIGNSDVCVRICSGNECHLVIPDAQFRLAQAA